MNKNLNFKKILLQPLSFIKKLFTSSITNKDQLINTLKQCLQNLIINHETYSILENTLNLADMQVRDIMMPKSQMVSILANSNYSKIVKLITQSGHSRFPVLTEHGDEILGILHAKDLLGLSEEEKNNLNLTDLVRMANFVPESKKLDGLLTDFKQNRNHMALVVNEYGQTIGFVTLEDTIEQILGEIADEFDVDEEDPIKFLAEKHFIIRADTELELLNERLHMQFDNSQFDTIGGLLTAQFGYKPKRGEQINFHDFKFKILSADSRRIKLVECFDKRGPSIIQSNLKES
jgi:magnesium and cobalt transporter